LLLSEILCNVDAIIKSGVVYSTLFDGTNIEMHAINKIRDGVICTSKSKRQWAKGDIQNYVRKFTVSSVLPNLVEPVVHNLERVSKVVNMYRGISNLMLDLEMSIITPYVYFIASEGKWFIFGSFGAITGFYDGFTDIVIPLDFVMKFIRTSSWLLYSDNYFGVSFSDLSFKYVIYHTHINKTVLSKSDSKTMYIINNIGKLQQIEGKMKFGDMKMDIYHSPYGMVYKNKDFEMYKISTTLEIDEEV